MIIVVAGGFDPIHGGHIDHLEKAAKLKESGDKLVVILAREDQLIAKKGFSFYQSYETRRKIMASLNMVDEVFRNIDTDTGCAETLKLLKPKFFVKGGDRTPDNMPVKEILACQEIGCTIVYGQGDLLDSSTKLAWRLENMPKSND